MLLWMGGPRCGEDSSDNLHLTTTRIITKDSHLLQIHTNLYVGPYVVRVHHSKAYALIACLKLNEIRASTK